MKDTPGPTSTWSTLRTLPVRLRPFASALVRTFLPERFPRPLTAEQVYRRYVGRVVIVGFLVFTNLLLLAELQDETIFRPKVGAYALGYIIGTLVLDLVASSIWLRKPNRGYALVAALLCATSVATLPVWMQLTGLTTSYLAAVPGIRIVVVRVTYSYSAAVVTTLSAAAIYVAAVLLEHQGVIPPAGLMTGPPTGVYASAAYQQMVVSSTLIMMLCGFMLGNLIVNQVARSEQILREAREQLRRVVAEAQLGRLSGSRLGDYAVEDLLGRGGMGEVYAARRTRDGKEVAVKVLHAHLGADKLMRARFRREAEVVRELPASTVAAVHEFGTNAEGYDYIVMDRLRGEDLGALLRRRERLALDEVVAIVERVALALDAAHAHGVIHRDLKPQNVFLCGTPGAGLAVDVRLLDFGIARLQQATVELSMTAAVLGTPGYMSPEQASGAEIGPPADVFALGSIVYRALTGQPAFPARSPQGALFEALHHDPAPASERVAGLPRDVDAVIALALAKDVSRRYARASELARELALAARGELGAESRARAAALPRSSALTQPTMTSV